MSTIARPSSARLASLGLCALGLVLTSVCNTSAPQAGPPRPHHVHPRSPAWQKVDDLVNDQKLEEASQEVAKILAAAKQRGDDDEWAEALVRAVQLRIGLGGYETAVRFLKEQPWPKAGVAHVALDLYYARTLVTYLQAYGWEIGQREKVESKQAVDLKAWTKEQIFDEAMRGYGDVWAHRAELADQPLDAMSVYLTPNNYPAHVRDTLRDAVSYLAVELLADSSHWRPEQSNDLFRLDFRKLLAGGAPDAAVKLDDPAQHPLARIGAILDDLEGWHAASGDLEAAFEARLERLRRLHASFTDEAERKQLLADLEARLPKVRRVAWWSMGTALRAEWIREAGDAVLAHRVAEEGARAYPGSVGGSRCLRIQREIEAPAYALESMSTDGPGKRAVLLTHKNLGAVWLRAYAVDLVARIESARDYNLFYDYQELRKLVSDRTPVAEWKVELPSTPDFGMHRTFVTPPLAKKGVYVIVASARKDFQESGNQVVAAHLVVSDLVMLVRSEPMSQKVTVVSGSSGKPLAGVELWLYRFDWQSGHHRVGTFPTDGNGEAHVPLGQGAAYFLLAHDKRTQDLGVDPQQLYATGDYHPGATRASFVYTDRSIYRPQQKLFWKVVAYEGQSEKASFHTAAKSTVNVELVDPNWQVVDHREVTTNDFGTAAGEFTIPTGRLLGQWHVRSSWNGEAQVRVEEYKRPTFEVSFKEPTRPLRLNQPAELVGEAKYYFGLPVTSGRVKWRVLRTPVYAWWWGYWWYGAAPSSPQTVAQGSATVESDGTFKVRFTPEAAEKTGKEAEGTSYSYAVSADFTDEGGETRSAERSVRLGYVSVEAHLGIDGAFLREGGDPGRVSATRTSLDGAPRAGKGRWKLVALAQPAKALMPSDEPIPPAPPSATGEKPYRTPGDALRPRWEGGYSVEGALARWEDGGERAHGELTHDDKGAASITLPTLGAGAYRLRYETTDDFGARYTTWKDFLVAPRVGHAGAGLALPAFLAVESGSVPVGGIVRVLLGSGLEGQPLFYDRYRNGKLVERKRLSAGESGLYEIAVGEADRGGFSLGLELVRDHQHLSFTQSIYVPWDDRQLDVSFSTFRDRLRPGAKETFRVTVKTPAGNTDQKTGKRPLKAPEAGAVELLAYMYDRSLDIFAPHYPPSPLQIYPGRTGASPPHASLGTSSAQWILGSGIAEIPSEMELHGDSLQFFDGYAIGGMGMRGGGGMAMDRMGAPMPSAPAMAAAPPPPKGAPAPARARAEAKEPAADKPSGNVAAEKREDARTANASTPAKSPPGPEVRSNFSETAFWQPQLITDGKGEATIELQVPDSVTSWNVWVHAITRDLKSGSLNQQTRSVKDLMVRPYLPRFFREGDKAELKVVVNDAGQRPLTGELSFEIFDPDTKEDLAKAFQLSATKQRFTVAAGGGTNVSFPVVAPKRVGVVAFRVIARAGDLSDGELRPLPVLPGRMHLAQSRFVTLRGKDSRTLRFDDLARSPTEDPSLVTEQMVVTVDAQLFYTVLKALPYLVNYPYECTEQTLNRFVSTGIASSLYGKFPAVGKMAQQLSSRTTELDPWDAKDPNRRMALEESPWLLESRGQEGPNDPALLNVLDPHVARAQRDSSLERLRKMQTSNGAFPWFPGGPPSEYMTLYIMYGFAKAAEFGVDVPKDVVQRGWSYLAAHYRSDWLSLMREHDAGWELLTFLNYAASSYPDGSWVGGALTDGERKEILAFSFKHWRDHSPLLKGMLALTLKRMGRLADGKKVFASVMDSAKTEQDQGTFWAPEDRSWLWYNDTIETHAFAVRVLLELEPQHAKLDGLVLWLMLNKKLNQWKSTRATAEVIYSLAHYLQKEGSLGAREEATVSVGGRRQTFVYEPDRYVGKQQLVLKGAEVDPKQSSTITVEKPAAGGKGGIMFASATWHFSTEKLPSEDRGDFFSVSRRYFKRVPGPSGFTLQPLAEGATVQPGDRIEVQLSLRTKHAAEYVHLRDPRAAGLEPENAVSQYRWDLGIGWYEETRDSGSNFFFEQLPVGEYTFKYRLRANLAGTFRVGPATVQSLYAPEFNAYSAGHVLTVAATGK